MITMASTNKYPHINTLADLQKHEECFGVITPPETRAAIETRIAKQVKKPTTPEIDMEVVIGQDDDGVDLGLFVKTREGRFGKFVGCEVRIPVVRRLNGTQKVVAKVDYIPDPLRYGTMIAGLLATFVEKAKEAGYTVE